MNGSGAATGGSERGYWRLRAWEEIVMKMFGPPPPLFIKLLGS